MFAIGKGSEFAFHDFVVGYGPDFVIARIIKNAIAVCTDCLSHYRSPNVGSLVPEFYVNRRCH